MAEMPVSPVKLSLREMTEQTLLHQIAPAAAMVNSRGDILYIHGRTGLFLEMPPGDIGINNILKMARKGLKRDLTASLYRAVKTKDIVYSQSLRVKTNGSFITANLTVLPVPSDSACIAVPLYLVIMEEAFSPDRQQRERKKKRGGIFPPFFSSKSSRSRPAAAAHLRSLFFSIYFLLGSDKGKLNERGPSNLNRWTLFFPFEPFNP